MKNISTQASVFVLLALLGAAPAPAQRPTAGSWRDAVRRLGGSPIALPAHGRARPAVRPMGTRDATTLAATIAESEPNDSVRTADSVAVGDQATGIVNPAGDVDTWFVDLGAGEFVSVDVDAAEVGSPLDAVLALFAPDGRTLLAFNDDFDGFDSRISYRVPTSGRYYVTLRAFGAAGSPALTYAINFGKVTCSATETDQEPNDTPETAARATIGDSVSGEICPHDANPAGDVDYWVFTAQAATTIELDVDAAALGSLVDPVIALYASDGTTQLAFNDDAGGADSRLRYSITTTGTYYATVADAADPGGNPFPYILHVRSIAAGPGDPVTVRAAGLGLPLGLAVGATGDLFVGDVTGNRVVRISSQGTATTFATGIQSPFGLAFDASGSLLVASGDGAVYRVTPQGQATRFISDAGGPFWIAVAADGRIWLTDVSDRSLRRYTAAGQLEARFDAVSVGGSGPGPLAIAPSGEPYFSQGTEIWKLANGRLERVFADAAIIWAFAFDVAGNIYAPMPTVGRLKLFGPTGTALADPFAVGVDAPQAVAFARDETGATVARLFATDTPVGQVIEVNPAGVGHRGQPVGYVPPLFTPEVAAASLLGAGGLSAADLQYLDALGNHNGRYDVGDLQAFLRTASGLPGTAAHRQPESNR